MAPYEDCRKLLAADKSEGIPECASAMAKAAGSLLEEAGAHRKHVAVAATALAEIGPDLVEQRLAFGEVSQGIVGLLSDAPNEAKKYHIFECPMAEGYKRWVQVSEEIANPYMGTKMLACGSKIEPMGEPAN